MFPLERSAAAKMAALEGERKCCSGEFWRARSARWHAYNRTVTELSGLDDRTLGDINITRSEIRAVARRASLQVA